MGALLAREGRYSARQSFHLEEDRSRNLQIVSRETRHQNHQLNRTFHRSAGGGAQTKANNNAIASLRIAYPFFQRDLKDKADEKENRRISSHVGGKGRLLRAIHKMPLLLLFIANRNSTVSRETFAFLCTLPTSKFTSPKLQETKGKHIREIKEAPFRVKESINAIAYFSQDFVKFLTIFKKFY